MKHLETTAKRPARNNTTRRNNKGQRDPLGRGRQLRGTSETENHTVTLDAKAWQDVSAKATQATGMARGVSELLRQIGERATIENGVLMLPLLQITKDVASV